MSKGRWNAGRVFAIIAAVIILFIVLGIAKGIYTEWLWFNSLGYASVYTTVLKTEVLLFFAAALIFAVLFLGNLALAARFAPGGGGKWLWPWGMFAPRQKSAKIGIILGTAVLALIFGLEAQGQWQVVLQFFNAEAFAVMDPVFHKDVAFYVFSLPFFHMVRGWFLGALIVCLIAVAGMYFFSYSRQRMKFDQARSVMAHGWGIMIAILGLAAWSYRLDIWGLVFSPRGVVFGASYADLHAKLPGLWVLFAVVIICAVVIVISIMRRNLRWPLYAIGGWIVVAIIAGAIVPSLMQRFQVQPSEFAMEKPYIEYNIDFTREAFALNRIEELAFPAEESPTAVDIAQNVATIDNIRLWDHRPLKDTYNQIQAIRLYYDFNDVDVDRYTIDGEYQQVMLSARELSAEKLAEQAQTWVNRKLQFTHGYGLALSPVNEVTPEGLPVLMVKDIPPIGDFEIVQPAIYFGEKTDDYVIVNTDTPEFDYPMGDENVYGYYQGDDGVMLNSFFRRLVYAWQFSDFNILISGELNSESRVLYYRDIKERVHHLAPFLELDSDPYLVVNDGGLFWVQDAYTTTDSYPYSQPLSSGGPNYIRNSVKVVVDAYNGTAKFYVVEPDDALIRTYQNIFPDLFLPIEDMSESMRAHLRYPLDMFDVQVSMYRSYHMKDAAVFYSREDMWAVPREIYAGTEQPVEPYYVIMSLPDEENEEFLLMLPFTPVNKNNTIAWLAARCDGENYGTMLDYKFPKDKLIYGPSQIENRIQQNTVITEQLALWSRGGSRVIRGNLLMIPLGKSNLYVEPVFLQAEAGGLPELKRIIVAAGDQIAMKSSLGESLAAIFDTEVTPPEPPQPPEPPEEPQPPGPEEPEPGEISLLIEQAQLHYDKAQEYLKEGNWAGYGTELERLGEVLRQLEQLAEGTE
ncbi:MAG: UPF0182 family protein [Dehalococcoidia bacterium]|nr:UPF0182 family protein [Dehalococcoidia bacterium]